MGSWLNPSQLLVQLIPSASTTSPAYDTLFWAIHLVALIFGGGVFAMITFLTIRYRRGARVNRQLAEHEGIALELTWTIIPLIILVALFVWSASAYFTMIRVPRGAMEVTVVGKQWMWKLQQPNGRWEMNELHVPLGKPVKLTMISEDVIHDFGIPAFRIKQDVIPGKYTQMWFEATQEGRYRIFCSQYCGTKHSIMAGFVHVMKPADYQAWLAQGNVQGTMASNGEQLFRQNGCTGCHGANSNVRAPSLEGLWNKPRPVQVREPDGTYVDRVITADFRYIHDSIVLPEKEIAAGYRSIMPTYRGQLSEEEIAQLVDYIRSLSTSNGTANGSAKNYIPEKASSYGSDETTTGVPRANPNDNLGRMRDRDRVYQNDDMAYSTSGAAKANLGRMIDRDAVYGTTDTGRNVGSLRSGLTDDRPDTVGGGNRKTARDAPQIYSGLNQDTYARPNPQPDAASSSTPELDRDELARARAARGGGAGGSGRAGGVGRAGARTGPGTGGSGQFNRVGAENRPGATSRAGASNSSGLNRGGGVQGAAGSGNNANRTGSAVRRTNTPTRSRAVAEEGNRTNLRGAGTTGTGAAR
jgi:cytochrome c oxidase subunit 2